LQSEPAAGTSLSIELPLTDGAERRTEAL
jgi:hypothetical protein